MTEEPLIVAISDEQQVLMIATESEVLEHIRQHLVGPDHNSAALPGQGTLKFYNSGCQQLHLVVSDTWDKLAFQIGSGRVNPSHLQSRIDAVLAARQESWATTFHTPRSAMHVPAAKDWTSYLAQCKTLCADDNAWPHSPARGIELDHYANIVHFWVVHHGHLP